ncbi:hypothetical protein B0T25DRAFT_528084 [Lasiosphaeria hispida]|uniref:Secreted protein n=1 Tax=Lasiosphaeria hispida TaxID=260671 RepID=A0AAJ0HVF6_9PEZI|nr:hypothetical protein B0T25DRAFT_528084 [Lasiosphaeria hispida]
MIKACRCAALAGGGVLWLGQVWCGVELTHEHMISTMSMLAGGTARGQKGKGTCYVWVRLYVRAQAHPTRKGSFAGRVLDGCVGCG